MYVCVYACMYARMYALMYGYVFFRPPRSDQDHFSHQRVEGAGCSTFVQGGAPLSKVLSSVFPGVGVDGNAFTEIFRLSMKRFFCPPCERFPTCSSAQKSLFGSRWSGMRAAWPAHRK